MRNVLDKLCGENQNIHLMFNFHTPTPPTKKPRAAYEIMWGKKGVEPDRPQITIYVIWRKRTAWWTT